MRLKISGNLRMNEKLIAVLDVKNMLPTCEMILKSALARKESRGAHYRVDFPETSSKERCNIICTPTKKGVNISTRSIPRISKEIAKFLKEKGKGKAHLLE